MINKKTDKLNKQSILIEILLWYIIVFYPILLFGERIIGLWIPKLTGYSLIITVLIGIVFLVGKTRLSISKILFYLFYLALLFISIIASGNKFPSYSFNKDILLFFGYLMLPGIFGMLLAESNIELSLKHLLYFAIITLSISIILIIFNMKTINLTMNLEYYRAGTEANSIAFSYSVLASFIFMIIFLQNSKNKIAENIVAILAIIILFLLGTRQTLIGVLLFFIINILIVLFSNKKYHEHENTKAQKNTSINILIGLILIFILMYLYMNMQYISILSNTSLMRWESFLARKGLDIGRQGDLVNALEIIKSNILFGKFGYELPGSYAHNTVINYLAQFGIISLSIYIIMLMFSLHNSFIYLINDDTTLKFLSFVFIIYVLLGLTVGNMVFSPSFNLLFIYFFTVNIKSNN